LQAFDRNQGHQSGTPLGLVEHEHTLPMMLTYTLKMQKLPPPTLL